MRFIAVFLTVFALPLHAEEIPVFTPGEEGRPFIDVYASGLYSAQCVQGEGCTCAALPVDRAEMAVVLGLASVGADIQGIADSPVADDELTPETPEAIHARFGGNGYCPQTPLVPEDGTWRDGKPFNINVQCGEASAMFQQVLANAETQTAPIIWGGVFSGSTVQTAFMTANPDPEYTPHNFVDVTPTESVGTAQIAGDGGAASSTGRMRLITPRQFVVQWDVKGSAEGRTCNWTMQHLATRVGP